MTTDATRDPRDGEILRLRSRLQDLRSLLALLTASSAHDLSGFARTVILALLEMLRLDFVYLRLNDGGEQVELAETGLYLSPTEIGDQVRTLLRSGEENWPLRLRRRLGGKDLSLVAVRLGLHSETGLLVAASDRSEFPSDDEILHLTVSANHLALALQDARLGREQAEDIDEATEDALRMSSRNARLIIENIPAGAALMEPNGTLEVANNRILKYSGKSLEESKQWAASDSIHPEDMPRAIEAFVRSVETGEPYFLEGRLRRFDGAYRWFQVRGLPILDASGNLTKWCVLHTDVDEQKRAEDALRESERNVRLIVDSIPGLVAVFSPSGEIEALNRQVLEYYGKTFEELKHWGIDDTVHPDDRARVVESFAHAIASGEPFHMEARARRSDGVYRWHQSRGFPYRDVNGRILHWYNLIVDIDEQKRAEEALARALAERERSLKLIVDTAPAAIWSAGPDGRTDSINQHFRDYTGLTDEQVQNSGWNDAVHPEDLDGVSAVWRGLRKSKSAGQAEIRLRRHDGAYRWFLIRVQPLRDENGDIVKWYGVNVDIQDRKQAEDELVRSEAFLAQGEAVSETGSFLWNIETGDIRWSEQLYRLFEWERDSPVTLERIATRVHPQDLPDMEEMSVRARAGLDSEYNHRLLMADGSIRFIHFVAKSVRDRIGRLSYMGTVQNITARKLAEEALERLRSELAHASRTMTLGVLTASIAHEVSQPLSGIVTNVSNCLDMLADDPPNLAGARTTTRRALRDADRASEVVQRLRMMFARKERITELVDLNDAAREILALSSSELQKNRILLRTDFESRLPEVSGDRVQLQQVMLNLVLNAADAMKDIGDRSRELMVATECGNASDVRLSVRDAGVGIDPKLLDQIFGAFYTTKPNGMGVGLSISRSIIESHGGRLWAQANDGPGATFSFLLPCPKAEERAQSAREMSRADFHADP